MRKQQRLLGILGVEVLGRRPGIAHAEIVATNILTLGPAQNAALVDDAAS
ncbi:MAG: hypothetical protein ACLVKA_07770 [Collinsella aerofaciens]